MILNGINFPNDLLDALAASKLVIFAGAGVSMRKPTNLPNFDTLAKEIACGVSLEKKKNVPCEVFLGHLKHNGIDVQDNAAKLLSDSCLRHNQLHETIIDLFRETSAIRIVTTNYDQMFEQALAEKGISCNIYNAPTLPLGNDFTGVVHVHGNINDPRYMVLTDEDFGKAYLAEGYSTRFIIKLFESFQVLFIGYSYNDTIMRYLTRAMSAAPAQKRFILTNDSKSNWELFGIQPILYPKNRNGHDIMAAGLAKLAVRATRSYSEWKNQFVQMSECPTQDISLDSEIEYCLGNLELSRMLANTVHKKLWFELLSNKGIFRNLFSGDANTDEIDALWAEWITKELFADFNIARSLFQKAHAINPCLGKEIIHHMAVSDQTINDDLLNMCLILLDGQINDPWEIWRLISIFHGRKQVQSCFHLFKKLFRFSINAVPNPWKSNNAIDYKYKFKADYDIIKEIWGICRNDFIAHYPKELLAFCKGILDDLYLRYRVLGLTTEPIEVALMVIEDRESHLDEDALLFINSIICEVRQPAELSWPEYVQTFLTDCLSSGFGLTKRIGLKNLRETSVYTDNEKYDLFIRYCHIDKPFEKEQAFLLIKSIFGSISPDRQDHFIQQVKETDITNDARNNTCWKYNWFVWIARFYPKDAQIQKEIAAILENYDFIPREHPELDYYFDAEASIDDESPKTKEELYAMANDELLVLLTEYTPPSSSFSPSRFALLTTFSQAVGSNYCWADRTIRLLAENKVDAEDVWTNLVIGIEKSTYSLDEQISLLALIVDNIQLVQDIRSVAMLLFNILRMDGIGTTFSNYEDVLFNISITLWEHRDNYYPDCDRFIDNAFNTALGNLLMCWVYMVNFHKDHSIPPQYKKMFEKCLGLRTWERSLSVGVLASHYNFFCARDKDWWLGHLNPCWRGSQRVRLLVPGLDLSFSPEEYLGIQPILLLLCFIRQSSTSLG